MQALQSGQYLSNRYNASHDQKDFDAAAAALSEALRFDPGLAQAAAEMAWLHVYAIEADEPAVEEIPQILEWSAAAARLDAGNGLGWSARAAVEAFKPSPDIGRIREYALRGAALSPRDAVAQHTLLTARLGLGPQAEAVAQALRLTPLHPAAACNAAFFAFLLERPGDALRYLDAAKEAAPDSVFALLVRPSVLADLGRLDEAADALARLKAVTAGNEYARLWVLMEELPVALERADRRAAQAAFSALTERVNDPNTGVALVYGVAPSAAPFLARHGRVDDALKLMAACIARGAMMEYDWLVQDTRLAALRADPRFKVILDKSRVEFLSMLTDVDAARSRGEFPAYLEQPLKDLRAKLGM